MTTPAIVVENLSKRYRVGARLAYGGLRERISDLAQNVFSTRTDAPARERQMWALKDISFRMEQGEIIGIIGRNGAGKSTLLRILAEITEPTHGRVELYGRVGALLEVGTGFHPELTGHDNVYLNGAILGMKRREIDARYDEIVAFSGVERFINTPLKYYSTGMAVRLGFAVSAYLEPEILIVDEVLAVGDLAFRERCLGKMHDVASGGRSVIFVSHSMAAISSLCPRTMWLNDGEIVFDGATHEAIGKYVAHSRSSGGEAFDEYTERRGTGVLLVKRVLLEDLEGNEVDAVASGEGVRIVLEYEAEKHLNLHNLQANVTIGSGSGPGIFSFLSSVSGADLSAAPPSGRLVCEVPELPLAPGHYDLQFSIIVGREVVDKVVQARSVVVVEGDYFGTGNPQPNVDYYGSVLVRHAWSVDSDAPVAGSRR